MILLAIGLIAGIVIEIYGAFRTKQMISTYNKISIKDKKALKKEISNEELTASITNEEAALTIFNLAYFITLIILFFTSFWYLSLLIFFFYLLKSSKKIRESFWFIKFDSFVSLSILIIILLHISKTLTFLS